MKDFINKHFLSLAVLTAIVLLGYFTYTALYINRSSDKINNLYIPLIEDLNKVQLEHSKAHLWFEELLSGDTSIDMKHIQNAYKHISDILNKCETILTALELKNEQLSLQMIKEQHSELEKLIQQRYEHQIEGRTGGKLDIIFDSQFLELLKSSEILALDIKSILHRTIDHMNAKKTEVIVLIFSLSLLLCYIVFSYIRLRNSYDAKLEYQVHQKTKDLEEARDKAEDSNRLKSEFLANMSHEIRTPLNAIVGFAELLAKKLQDNQYKEHIDNILNGSSNLLVIINDILDLSKLERGELEISPAPCSVHHMIKELQSMFHTKAQENIIQLDFDIAPILPFHILLDEKSVRKILFNLLSNAIKFTHEGRVVLKVTVDHMTEDTVDLSFSVKDTGIGIPEDAQEKMFYPFQQQEGQNSRRYGGTGLGLAICKKLAHLMNGEITLVSQVDKGSEFVLKLYNIGICKDDQSSPSQSGNLSSLSGTVLVVDDVQSNRLLVSMMLDEYGLTVLEAVNGQDALDVLKEHTPDLILMDIQMPVMDGFESCRHIRSDEKTKHIPMIALTASVMKEEIDSILKADFNGLIQKPIDSEHFIQTISRYLK